MSLSKRINDTNAAPWVIEEIKRMEAEMERLRSFRSAVCGWRESDWPEGFCRLTAELIADHGRQAEEEE